MTEVFKFEPHTPAHAIERCVATVEISSPLPDRTFERVVARVDEIAEQLALIKEVVPGQSFQLAFNNGQITPSTSSHSFNFVAADRSSALLITRNLLSWSSSRYIRWAPFRGRLHSVLKPVLELYMEAASVSSAKLEYVDRFYWTGDWDSITYDSLLSENSALVSKTWMSAKKEWHSHTGWFEFSSNVRRLKNVNVDAHTMQRNGNQVPCVSILTVLLDQVRSDLAEPNDAFADTDSILRCFQDQHEDSKKVLSQVLSDQASSEISLFGTGRT